MLLIFLGNSSVAFANACQSAGVASFCEVKAKQCINFFSPAMAEPVSKSPAAVQRKNFFMDSPLVIYLTTIGTDATWFSHDSVSLALFPPSAARSYFNVSTRAG